MFPQNSSGWGFHRYIDKLKVSKYCEIDLFIFFLKAGALGQIFIFYFLVWDNVCMAARDRV
jgi:hypothetical protein